MAIMVVDDNKDIATTLKMVLEKEGFTVHTAENGEDFLGKVDSVNPNLVLLDVMMPGLTTRDILQKLKDSGKGDLKVILVTVVRLAQAESESIMKEFTVVDYITKPFDVPDLVARVKKAIQ